jgi:hypothetical protein
MKNLNTLALVVLLTLPFMYLNAQISITSTSFNYTQNFLSYSGNSGGEPSGWTLSGGTGRGQGTGTDNTGGIWSYGLSGNTDRALGSLRSGSTENIFTVTFTNASGGILTAIDISYNFEQWRYANTSGFVVTSNIPGNTNLTDLNQNGVASGANGTPTTTTKTTSITGLSIAPGASITITFTSTNATGADNGIGVDDFSFTTSGVLPVIYTSLDAKNVGIQNIITWSTGVEINNDYFEIERSHDGNTFSSIGRLSVSTTQNYAYTDRSPILGHNFYRLKQVDLDGRYTHSETVTAIYNKTKTLVTVQNNLLQIQGEYYNQQLAIYSKDGRMIFNTSITESLDIDVSGWNHDMYILIINNGNTSEKFTVRI